MSMRELELKARGAEFGASVLWKHAGLLTLWSGDWCLHFVLPPRYWKLGHSVDEYDDCADYWGLGPLALLTRCNIPDAGNPVTEEPLKDRYSEQDLRAMALSHPDNLVEVCMSPSTNTPTRVFALEALSLIDDRGMTKDAFLHYLKDGERAILRESALCGIHEDDEDEDVMERLREMAKNPNDGMYDFARLVLEDLLDD